MRQRAFIALSWLGFALVICSAAWAQAEARPGKIGEFVHHTVGEWVGSYEESTNGEKANSRYFRAIIKASGTNSYEALFNYFKPDDKTRAPVKVGGSTVIIKLAPDGTATTTITGDGQVRMDSGRLKPERHQLCEVLRLSPDGALQGRGEGTIQVSGLPMGLGKNGRIIEYCSTWEKCDGLLKMNRQFKVRFRALGIRKTYDVKAEFIARPGGNLMELIRQADKKAGGEAAFSPAPK